MLKKCRNLEAVSWKSSVSMAGHLVRMSDDRAVKKVFLWKPDGKRKAGRPKSRCLDCSKNDLKSVGIKRWRKKTF
jgi:hypothetical protein